MKLLGLALEIIDQDNDFYHDAFASAQDSQKILEGYKLTFKF